ncbi:element excision factor XisI family protein [Dapis sp. BLCC M229]|uniref:element excision factor XisI family protein n=1 Tax=Dapis sp. BLCC M229 TaxID=3400188 RepID=UPI003CF83A7E
MQKKSNNNIENLLIIDKSNTNYIWINLGWQNVERITRVSYQQLLIKSLSRSGELVFRD